MAGTPLGGMDPTHRQQRPVVLGLVGFYFLKLLTVAGYITQPPPIIALTEVVFAIASVKATINHDL
jgi:hypothetical protein